MSVKLSVPTHLLAQPEVAEAVQRLILVLGGRSVSAAPSAPASAPRAQRVVQAPAAPAVVAAPPAKAKRRPQPKMTLNEFVDGLPGNSKKFLAIVHGLRVVKVSEMVRRLGLTNAKAVGGITGAIGRWGPARGVELPYERFILDGERAWRWIGPTAGLNLPAVPDAQTAAPSTPAPVVSSEPTVNDLLAQVSPAARRLAKALQAQSKLSAAEAAEAAQVKGAVALRKVVKELNAVAKPLGQRLVSDDLDVKGGVSYTWNGLQPVAPKVEPATPDDSIEEKGKGGLIRRRRRS